MAGENNAISWGGDNSSNSWNNLLSGSLGAVRDVAFTRLFGSDQKEVAPDRPADPSPKNNLPLIIGGAVVALLVVVLALKK